MIQSAEYDSRYCDRFGEIMQVSSSEVLSLLDDVLGASVQQDGAHIFPGSRWGDLLPLSEAAVDTVAAEVAQFTVVNPACVVSDHSYESIVEGDLRIVRIRPGDDEGLVLQDLQNDVTYSLSKASAAFCIYLGLSLRASLGPRWCRSFRTSTSYFYRKRESEASDPFTILQTVMRVWTLRIESSRPRNAQWWKPYADSLLFHLGYNLDIQVVTKKDINHLLEPSKIGRMRRATVRELDPPRRHYIDDLVSHYQLGIAAESPMLRYLSFYHVAEHWFENVFQDDLADQVQSLITSPNFSYRRRQDIRNLIKRVSKAIQIRDDEVVINEQSALRLTLAKYVDLPKLLDDLTAFDSSLISTYATQEVPFCSGDRANLADPNSSDLLGALSRRIYKTRNALVHSKESARGRFIPFRHDGELQPEVPLMRFVAEQIIVATSKVMPSA